MTEKTDYGNGNKEKNQIGLYNLPEILIMLAIISLGIFLVVIFRNQEVPTIIGMIMIMLGVFFLSTLVL